MYWILLDKLLRNLLVVMLKSEVKNLVENVEENHAVNLVERVKNPDVEEREVVDVAVKLFDLAPL